MLPLRLGSAEQFCGVKEFVERSGFTEPEVCARLGLDRLYQLSSRREEPALSAPSESPDAIATLMAVFLLGKSVSREQVERLIPADILEFMESLGLVGADASDARLYSAAVSLFPIAGLYFVSDRRRNPDGAVPPLLRDAVFPAIHRLTHEFLEVLPASPCERLLDLCSGTAIAALFDESPKEE